MTRASDVTCILLVAAVGCGNPVEPDPSSEPSTGATEPSTGATEPSTGASDTTAGLGQERPEVAGRWSCSGCEDPIWLDIEVYRVDPPSIEGWGIGADLDSPEDPFSSSNVGELAVNPAPPPSNSSSSCRTPTSPISGRWGSNSS